MEDFVTPEAIEPSLCQPTRMYDFIRMSELLLCKFRWNICAYIQASKYIRRRKIFNGFVENKSNYYLRFLHDAKSL